MRVARGCGGAAMTEYGLYMSKAQAALKQMGGIAVPEGVDRDFFLIPHWFTTAFMAA